VALLVGVFAFWALGGFDSNDTGPVRVAAPPALPGADETCAKLLNALPPELAGEKARPVTTERAVSINASHAATTAVS
jgi:hypothetical protein